MARQLSGCGKISGDELARHYGIFSAGEWAGVGAIFCHDDSVRLREFSVLDKYQGQGLGHQLLEAILVFEKSCEIKTF